MTYACRHRFEASSARIAGVAEAAERRIRAGLERRASPESVLEIWWIQEVFGVSGKVEQPWTPGEPLHYQAVWVECRGTVGRS